MSISITTGAERAIGLSADSVSPQRGKKYATVHANPKPAPVFNARKRVGKRHHFRGLRAKAKLEPWMLGIHAIRVTGVR